MSRFDDYTLEAHDEIFKRQLKGKFRVAVQVSEYMYEVASIDKFLRNTNAEWLSRTETQDNISVVAIYLLREEDAVAFKLKFQT